jgi:subtilase family serine protease
MHRATGGRARLRASVRISAGVCLAGLLTLAAAHAADGQYIAGNTPAVIASAKAAGAVSGDDVLTISLWLKPRNQAALDATAAALYNRASPQYRHWLTQAEVLRQFAPTDTDSATVKDFLTAQGLTVLDEGPDHFFVRATGTVSTIEKVFHVTLASYTIGSQAFRSNGSDPYIEGPAAALVQLVSGLDSLQSQQKLNLQPASLAALPARAAGVQSFAGAAAAAAPSGFSASCFLPPATKTYTTSGGYPKGVYAGNVYQTALAGCGYTPANIASAYHLDTLYNQGLDGTGQTITLVEPCGSPTIEKDANGFAKAFGLPALTEANFAIVHYPAPSACAGSNEAATADLEWAHAIAPGANIVLVVAPSSNTDDIDAATFYAVTSLNTQVIAGDFSLPEFFLGSAEAKKENLIAELAAISGIAVNYPSGDSADFAYIGFGSGVSAPADLPYATGVGGVSLALKTNGSLDFQTAWETHLYTLVVGGQVLDAPSEPSLTTLLGFLYGSGGGQSTYFAKPSFQSALKYKRRAVPDIAWLADPFTGGLVLLTQTNFYPPQTWLTGGGTALATAMFSGLWAIANQAAGAPLGQAAPYLYQMPPGLITDIVPTNSSHNVSAVIATSPTSVTSYTPAQVFAQPNSYLGPFISALYIQPGGNVAAVSFGDDYYLHPAAGWDPTTGLGTPNAAAFVQAFLPSSAGARTFPGVSP